MSGGQLMTAANLCLEAVDESELARDELAKVQGYQFQNYTLLSKAAIPFT